MAPYTAVYALLPPKVYGLLFKLAVISRYGSKVFLIKNKARLNIINGSEQRNNFWGRLATLQFTRIQCALSRHKRRISTIRVISKGLNFNRQVRHPSQIKLSKWLFFSGNENN